MNWTASGLLASVTRRRRGTAKHSHMSPKVHFFSVPSKPLIPLSALKNLYRRRHRHDTHNTHSALFSLPHLSALWSECRINCSDMVNPRNFNQSRLPVIRALIQQKSHWWLKGCITVNHMQLKMRDKPGGGINLWHASRNTVLHSRGLFCLTCTWAFLQRQHPHYQRIRSSATPHWAPPPLSITWSVPA